MPKKRLVCNKDQLHFIEIAKIMVIRLIGLLLMPVGQYGLYRICTYLAKFNPKAINVIRLSMVDGKCSYFFPSNDQYWSRLISNYYSYEPELEAMSEAIRGIDFTFMDCGANYGYWSLYITSSNPGCKSAVAVEASPLTFELLSLNQRENGGRFDVLHRAVGESESCVLNFAASVNVSGRAGDHVVDVVDVEEERRIVKVESITIDSLAHLTSARLRNALVIKLDVEGNEIQALRGAVNTISNFDVLIAYECHGKDMDSVVSKYVIEDLGLAVFHCKKTKEFERIRSVEEIRCLKCHRGVGYNFFACKAGGQIFGNLTGFKVRPEASVHEQF